MKWDICFFNAYSGCLAESEPGGATLVQASLLCIGMNTQLASSLPMCLVAVVRVMGKSAAKRKYVIFTLGGLGQK